MPAERAVLTWRPSPFTHAGLATYGWHIMGLYGVKSVMISNSRGFCIELATAMVVIVAARFGE